MGLFDKLKNIANSITGNAAKVELFVQADVYRNAPICVTIEANVKDAGIEIKRVYLRARATETVRITHTEIVNGNSVSKERTEMKQIHDFNFDFSGAQYLDPNKPYGWVKEISLPEGVQASYNVYPREVRWEMIAGLDTAGNDPDSGWKEVFVN